MNEPKKILQINVTVNSGSTGKIAEQIGEKVIERGWKSYIAYGRKKNESQSEIIRIGNNLSVYYHVLQTRLLDRQGLASVYATRAFVKTIDSINPDIVHLHNIHGYYLNYPILFNYLRRRDIPIVWTLHDCWPFTGHCAYFDYLGCEKWKTHCINCPGINMYPKSFVDRSYKNYEKKKKEFLFNKNIVLVPVSNWLNKILKNSFFRDAESITIHNGIDLNRFRYTNPNEEIYLKYGISGTCKVVLGVASPWSQRKGFDDFIKLRSELSDDFIIVLVGLSKTQIKVLPPGVIGIERTESQEELATLYSIASVFVNPTYEDNYPTTNIEALACGTPIITYDTGGSPEAIAPETGLVVTKGNICELAYAVRLLTEKEDDLRLQCRSWAEKNGDANTVYSRYMMLYDDLLSR